MPFKLSHPICDAAILPGVPRRKIIASPAGLLNGTPGGRRLMASRRIAGCVVLLAAGGCESALTDPATIAGVRPHRTDGCPRGTPGPGRPALRVLPRQI